MGDTLSVADDLVLDDYLELAKGAEMRRLSFTMSGPRSYRISEDTQVGQIGATLHLDCSISLIAQDSTILDALILVEVDAAGDIAAIYLLPLATLAPDTEYRLMGIDVDTAPTKFAQAACVSFTRGTQITLATGGQMPIEALRIGDKILTRDDGVQELRWIGQNTVRAVGAFAPICIRAGTLNNARDLVVSPDHRLFIYQRQDAIGAGRSELLVKARHLVNDDSVTVQEGGFVDYFQLLFDRHQIIYAEGIAAETMLVDTRTKAILPEELEAITKGHTHLSHAGLDVASALLDRPDAADILRKASTR